MSDESIDFSDIPPAPAESWKRGRRRLPETKSDFNAPLLAKRHLVLMQGEKKEEIDVEIGPLTRHPQDASCHVRIKGPKKELNYDIFGVDDVQALQLALRFVGSELDRLGGDHWQYLEEPGHGFDRILDLKNAS